MIRLRPVRRAAQPKTAARPARKQEGGPAAVPEQKTQADLAGTNGPAGLQNPYDRYYSTPRSFEQLVRAQRAAAGDAKTPG